jgi:molecular chaperone GrpE
MSQQNQGQGPSQPEPGSGEPVREWNLDEPVGDGGSTDAAISEKMQALERELEDAKSRALRLMADFQNYQRRALQNEQTARSHGIGAIAMGVAGVIDHFDLALGQDVSKASAEQILAGVRVIRDELMKSLQQYGVSLIAPAKNDEFVPGRHEAIMQQAAEGAEPGNIVMCLQPGYTLKDSCGERVLRPAKVSVAPKD